MDPCVGVWESRRGQGEKPSCDAAQQWCQSTAQGSGARMVLHSCPELGQDVWAIIECGLPGEGSVIVVEGPLCS